jgi:hypothetical protein
VISVLRFHNLSVSNFLVISLSCFLPISFSDVTLTLRLLPLTLGTIFDVTRKGDVYGPGKGYNVFAGKDGSMGLGKSSLKPEDAVPDYSTLDEKDKKTLDDWHEFFQYVILLNKS